ncbi:MAG: GntR family transcriptional regulator [Pseudonocardiales bacterium]|nr:GntR family transcriptional regulator [Pseudonocardiales bacterium]
MTDTRDPRPRVQQITADLRARIMSGELPPGSRLPAVRELMDHYGAASATIRGAQNALKTEGFLVSRAGLAVSVRDQSPLVIRTATYFELGRWSYDLLTVAETQPPAEIAEALNLDAEGTAILRQRLTLRDGEPVDLSWSYYPTDLAAGSPLAGQRKIKGGAPAVLAALGHPERYFTDRVSARMPTSEELEILKLPVDVPVLRQFRVIYSDTRPVAAAILIKGAHRHEVLYHETVASPPP